MIAKQKHEQALERECDAAKALTNKKSNEKVILHFESTTWRKIDGDWPSLILNIRSPSNVSNKFTLRQLFFVFQDCQSISKMIVETLYRLPITVTTTSKFIRELIDGFMTDSVTKNLQVEHIVNEELGSDYIPPPKSFTRHCCLFWHQLQKKSHSWNHLIHN